MTSVTTTAGHSPRPAERQESGSAAPAGVATGSPAAPPAAAPPPAPTDSVARVSPGAGTRVAQAGPQPGGPPSPTPPSQVAGLSAAPRAPVSPGAPDPAAHMSYDHKQGMRGALTHAQDSHVVGASPGELGRNGLATLNGMGYDVKVGDSQVTLERDGQLVGSTARYPDSSAAGWATTMHTLGNNALSDMNQNRGMNVTGESMYRTMMEGSFNGTLDPHTRFEPEGPRPQAAPANAA